MTQSLCRPLAILFYIRYILLLEHRTCKYKVRIEGNCNEYKNQNGCYYIAYCLPSLKPDLIVPAKCLKSAPETVGKVEPKCNEPYDVDCKNNRVAEGLAKEYYRVGLLSACPGRKLHMRPEVCKVECKHTKNNYSKKKHIARSPILCCSLVCNSISLFASCPVVDEVENECIHNVNNESGSKYRYKYSHNWEGHKLTTHLKELRTYERECVDCCVNKEKEN